MKVVRVPDVGHGLAAEIQTTSGEIVQIDCGSKSHLKYEVELGQIRSHCFFLSHYHEDHYIGLKRVPDDHAHIEKVRFPRVPDFDGRHEFLKALLATELISQGQRTGAWRTDLYQTLCRINNTKFSFEPVSQGDSVNVGSSKFEVLWPPKNIPDGARKNFICGVKNFKEAIKRDELLREVAEKIEEQEMIEPYLSGAEVDPENYDRTEVPSDPNSSIEERKVPEVTKKARKSLKDAADQMGIVMHMDNRLLSMGDIPERYIDQVVERLINKGRDHFHVIITSHHGTRWHSSMEQLSTNWAVSSAGKRDDGRLELGYKSISDHNHVTLWNGELFLRGYMMEGKYPHIPKMRI